MITLSYDRIRSPIFTDAVRRIFTYTGFKDTKVAYHCGRVCNLINTEFEQAQKLYTDLVKRYALTDEGGNFIGMEKGEQFHVPDEKMEEFKNASKDFHKHCITIDKYPMKITGEDLVAMQIAPAHLEVLEDIVDMTEFNDG